DGRSATVLRDIDAEPDLRVRLRVHVRHRPPRVYGDEPVHAAGRSVAVGAAEFLRLHRLALDLDGLRGDGVTQRWHEAPPGFLVFHLPVGRRRPFEVRHAGPGVELRGASADTDLAVV